eukprot:CAMPEP_0196782114 /NCGR_PEP_ID=MMETSP1104-20130614/10735_1 /TAXON_ID=33652 /ORGANISM="Cafeteria sp., Strain Caron Lab Isolate" /LENGTH=114 /DNA_ID=CAMNT_0042152345 /DNA_START=20 /DNA_END=364 /DNA_ORIENTATION=+
MTTEAKDDGFEVQNFAGDEALGEEEPGRDAPVHIRIQQRNARKTITSVQGLATDLDLKKILKFFKRKFKCNGAVITDKTLGDVIQLQGDQRQGVKEFLLYHEIVHKDSIIVHGF